MQIHFLFQSSSKENVMKATGKNKKYKKAGLLLIYFVSILFYSTFAGADCSTIVNTDDADLAGYFDDGIDGPYIDNEDRTISDLGTGLMWQRVDNNRTYEWEDACEYCEDLNLAGYSDWELPDILQLRTLIDADHFPKINTAYFTNCKSYPFYWSGSTVSHYTENAWYVGFDYGVVNHNLKDNTYYVRCVRSGPEIPPVPYIEVKTSGTIVNISWNPVDESAKYIFYYAPYPYIDYVATMDMGNLTYLSLDLPEGSAFYISVKAYNTAGTSDFSNVEYFIINGPDNTFTNSIDQTFTWITAGSFKMGSPIDEPGRKSDEIQHEVTLTKDFYMQKTEVTQAQWERLMGSNPSPFPECGGDCPVTQVSWDDIQIFLSRLNSLEPDGAYIYSLPTEAQWEYAARSGSEVAFATGGITKTACDEDPALDKTGWYCWNSESELRPVAQKNPNAWGLFDMHGNVWEWCSDMYGAYTDQPATDPVNEPVVVPAESGTPSGATEGQSDVNTPAERVVRGGAWHSHAAYCRSAFRYYYGSTGRYRSVGFRLVATPSMP